MSLRLSMCTIYVARVLDDGVDHPVVTAAGRMQANQLVTEGSADPSGFSTSGPKMNSTHAVTIFSGNRCRSRTARAESRIW